MAIEIVSFRKFEKNTLKGFLTILMTNIGLEIRDCALQEKDGKKWVNLPRKAYEKDDGTTGYITRNLRNSFTGMLDNFLVDIPALF